MSTRTLYFPYVVPGDGGVVSPWKIVCGDRKPEGDYYKPIAKRINELSYKKNLLEYLPSDIRMGAFAFPERSDSPLSIDFGDSWTLAGLIALIGRNGKTATRSTITSPALLLTGKVSVELGKVYVGRVSSFTEKFAFFIKEKSLDFLIAPSENMGDIERVPDGVRIVNLHEFGNGKRSGAWEKTVLTVGSSPDELKELIYLLFPDLGKAPHRALKMRHFPRLSSRGKKLALLSGIFCLPLLLILLSFLLIPIPDPHDEKNASTTVHDYNGEILRVFRSASGQFMFPYDNSIEIPERLAKAVIMFEDKRFYDHVGVDPFAVIRAVFQNSFSGKRISGASTITMQLARLLEGKPRTYGNKFKESVQALKLEMRYSKKDVLKRYLSRCPYGGNIYGFRTASLRYFRKEPRELSWAEAALLAVLPNAPGLMHPEKNQDALTVKRNKLLERLWKEKQLSATEYTAAIAERTPRLGYPFDVGAWHLAQNLALRNRSTNIHTTLFKDAQQRIERLFADSAKDDSLFSNFAFLAVENRTGLIRVWLGSQDFFDEYVNGQVDGTLAPRPAAGMLQPFLYALMIDRGEILPDALIEDTPGLFSGYQPTNSDGRYLGACRAGEALRQQRTVPAVRLLDRYGVDDFYAFLKYGGVKTLVRQPEWYRYSLVSDGVDVRLMDLAHLYSGLARQGLFASLEVTGRRTTIPSDAKRLFSEGAAWLIIKEMLLNTEVRGVETAYTTGCTRSGRDCWTAALTPDWTVVVWGADLSHAVKMSEEKVRKNKVAILSGLALSAMSLLPDVAGVRVFEKPEKELKQVVVCADTGYPDPGFCKKKAQAEVPSSLLAVPTCPYHDKNGKLLFPPRITDILKSRTASREKD